MTATAVHQTAATDPDGPTGQLATWVAGLTLDDIPQTVVERAKHLLLDGLGCGLIGAQLPWSRVATDAVLDLENSGDAAVIGTGKSTSGPAAAVLNGTFIQGFELDDFHPIAPGAQLFAGHSRAALDSDRAVADHHRRRLSARGDHRLRGRPARRLHAARRADARPWLALRPGVRHPLGGDGFGQTARAVAGPVGGCAGPGRHPVGGFDGRAVRGDEQAHAPRLRRPQRLLRRRARGGELHRHQTGLRA